MRVQEYFAAKPGGPPESGAVLRRQCIVSHNPLVSGVFIARVMVSVGARDQLEIIVDRRRDHSAAHQVLVERRHRDHVDRALEREGFAFLPKEAAKRDPRSIERDVAEETDERTLERILWLKNERITRLRRLVILSGLLNAILILFFVAPVVKTRLTQARPTVSAPSVVAPVDQAGESQPRPLP